MAYFQQTEFECCEFMEDRIYGYRVKPKFSSFSDDQIVATLITKVKEAKSLGVTIGEHLS